MPNAANHYATPPTRNMPSATDEKTKKVFSILVVISNSFISPQTCDSKNRRKTTLN